MPCQDLSVAGKGAGIDGERSGLWRCFADAIRVIQPRGVLIENVAALRSRGLDRVLFDLASRGYDAEWDVIPAAAVGAPHLRERVFIIAYRTNTETRFGESERFGNTATDSGGTRLQGLVGSAVGLESEESRSASASSEAGWPRPEGSSWFTSEPELVRMADGVPDRAHRLKCLGNAVVPQAAEHAVKILLERIGE